MRPTLSSRGRTHMSAAPTYPRSGRGSGSSGRNQRRRAPNTRFDGRAQPIAHDQKRQPTGNNATHEARRPLRVCGLALDVHVPILRSQSVASILGHCMCAWGRICGPWNRADRLLRALLDTRPIVWAVAWTRTGSMI